MKEKFRKIMGDAFSNGGLIGAFLGAIASTKVHKPDDSNLEKAGKTAAMSGLGYLLGEFVEKKVTENRKAR